MAMMSQPTYADNTQAGYTNSQQQSKHYAIGAGLLSDVLTEFAAVSGVKLSFQTATLQGLTSPGLSGHYSVAQGFEQLLADSPYRADLTANGYILVPTDSVALPSVNVLASGLELAEGPVEGYIAKRTSTATKMGVAIEDIPQTINVITADKMEIQGASRITEALAYSPGVNAAPWGDQPQWDWIYIRGFDAYKPGVYLDGLQMRNNGNWGMWQVDSYSLERLEVLKGPSSVMYGVNGPGGVINLVSKRPTTFSQKEIVAEIGNNSHKQLAVDFSGPIDQRGEWLYRVTALTKNSELENTPLDDKRHYFAPSVTWSPTTQTHVTLYGQWFDIDSGTDTNEVLLAGSLLPNPNGQTELPLFGGSTDFNGIKQEQWLIGYDAKHQFDSGWMVSQKARYAKFDMDFRTVYKSGWIIQNADDPADKDNFRFVKLTGLASKEDVTSKNIDTYISKDFDFSTVKHQIMVGVDYQKTDFEVDAAWGATFAPLDILNPQNKLAFTDVPSNITGLSDVKQTGVYIQDQISIGEHWVVNLATRYDETETNSYQLNGSFIERQKSYGQSSRVGVVYKAANGLAPYVSYSESFAPTGTIDPAQLKPFPPERGQQIEAGVRYTPLDNSGRYSLAAFDITRKDYTQWVWDDQPHPEQKGEVNVQGAELEVFWQPSENTNLMASYTWIPKAEVVDSINPAEIGKQSNAVSEHSLSVWADYYFDSGFQLGLGARYNGENNGTGENAPKTVPGYTLVDGSLKYDLAQWSLALNVRNLFDQHELSTCNNKKCYYTSGRRMTLSATYVW
ncbi:TonB-dependent siderophore receptor [Bowmanella denitrificans]